MTNSYIFERGVRVGALLMLSALKGPAPIPAPAKAQAMKTPSIPDWVKANLAAQPGPTLRPEPQGPLPR